MPPRIETGQPTVEDPRQLFHVSPVRPLERGQTDPRAGGEVAAGDHPGDARIGSEAGVAAWFARAEATDAEEDREHGTEKRGDEMSDWVADKQGRLERVRAAGAAPEEARRPPPAEEDDGPGPSSGMMKSAKPERARRRPARPRAAQLHRSRQPPPTRPRRRDRRL